MIRSCDWLNFVQSNVLTLLPTVEGDWLKRMVLFSHWLVSSGIEPTTTDDGHHVQLCVFVDLQSIYP